MISNLLLTEVDFDVTLRDKIDEIDIVEVCGFHSGEIQVHIEGKCFIKPQS